MESVVLGGIVWAAEDLDVDVPGSVLNANGGRLYNWDEAQKGAEMLSELVGEKLVVASDEHWKRAEIALGMKMEVDKIGWRSIGDVGAKLREGKSIKLSLNGFGCISGCISSIGSYGCYWTSTEDKANAFARLINSNAVGIYRNTNDKNYRYSVRCVKG